MRNIVLAVIRKLAVIACGMAVISLFASPALAQRLPGTQLVSPPGSHAYDYSLTDWSTMFWEWYYAGSDPAQSKVGDVQFMPLPSGEAVPNTDPPVYRGALDITVPAGTPIVLPLFAISYETYNTGQPDDTPFPDAFVLDSVHPYFTIDGVPVVTDANKADYYIPATSFPEPILYPEPTGYGSIGLFAFQGDTVLIKPLPVGQHTIHLYEPWVLPGIWAFAYDNTWNVTVTP